MSMSRRQWLASAASAAAAISVTGSSLARRDSRTTKPVASGIELNRGATIVFQGDSITDGRRNRDQQNRVNDLRALGSGYVAQLALHLLTTREDLNLQIYNRGISGNKVPQLADRWRRDCLDLRPDVVSVMIGVNDVWHKMRGDYDGTIEGYRDGLLDLMNQTRARNPNVQFVVMQPFVLPCGPHVRESWSGEFSAIMGAAEAVANEVGAVWVPLHDMFNQLRELGCTPEDLAPDGIHPSPQGTALMAMRWLSATGLA